MEKPLSHLSASPFENSVLCLYRYVSLLRLWILQRVYANHANALRCTAVNLFLISQIEAALQKSKKPYKLIPVRFVEEGGTKMGHTVIMNWDAKVPWGMFPSTV